MSKITVNAILTVIRLVASLLSKCLRLIYAALDLVDDGCINASVPRPDWVVTLQSVLTTIEQLSSHISGVEDEVYNSLTGSQS